MSRKFVANICRSILYEKHTFRFGIFHMNICVVYLNCIFITNISCVYLTGIFIRELTNIFVMLCMLQLFEIALFSR